jgi:hypothetical protein
VDLTQIQTVYPDDSYLTGPEPSSPVAITTATTTAAAAAAATAAATASAARGSYYLPTGTWVVVNAFSLHRSPANWERPDECIPERWLHADGSLRHDNSVYCGGSAGEPAAFVPFSHGPRNCLGVCHVSRVRLDSSP